jgi:hypothetical protein
VQIVEEFRCFEAEVVEISRAIDLRDVDKGNALVGRLDQVGDRGGLFDLVRIVDVHRALTQLASAIDAVDGSRTNTRSRARSGRSRAMVKKKLSAAIALLIEGGRIPVSAWRS